MRRGRPAAPRPHCHWSQLGTGHERHQGWNNYLPLTRKQWRSIFDTTKVDVLLLSPKPVYAIGHTSFCLLYTSMRATFVTSDGLCMATAIIYIGILLPTRLAHTKRAHSRNGSIVR